MTDALTLALQPGLDEGLLGALHAARAVALARHHSSPVNLEIHDSGYIDEPLPPDFARELDELRTVCQREERAARALPAVDAAFLERARERELAFKRGEIASGPIANPRAA